MRNDCTIADVLENEDVEKALQELINLFQEECGWPETLVRLPSWDYNPQFLIEFEYLIKNDFPRFMNYIWIIFNKKKEELFSIYTIEQIAIFFAILRNLEELLDLGLTFKKATQEKVAEILSDLKTTKYWNEPRNLFEGLQLSILHATPVMRDEGLVYYEKGSLDGSHLVFHEENWLLRIITQEGAPIDFTHSIVQ